MDQRTLSLYLSRILSGFYLFFHKAEKYKLIYPDIHVKYQAELYAQQEYEDNKFNTWLNEQDILYSLINLGLWSINGDDNLKKLETQIDDIKVDLYKNFYNPTKVKSLRRNLSNTKNAYFSNYNIRHSFDNYTIEGYLDSLKNQYILANSIYTTDNKLVFNDLEDINYLIFNSISNTISKDIIDTSTYRQIARSNLWSNYWSANNQIFDGPVINWTDEQKMLVMFTKMYDSAREHSECPPEKVFDDDDIFDGWMINQKRENEKTKNKNRTEKMLEGKNLNKAGEIFVMANSQEEAQNIYDLNDNTSRHIIKERESIIKRSPETVGADKLPDAQRQLTIQANEQFKRK